MVGYIAACTFDQCLLHIRGQTTVDHDRFKVDDGAGGERCFGKFLRGLSNPGFNVTLVRAPIVAVPKATWIKAYLREARLKQVDRGDVDQLATFTIWTNTAK